MCQLNRGVQVGGTFSTYALANPNYCIPIPDSLPSIQAAPLLCAGVTVWKGLKEVRRACVPGALLLVTGCAGGLGSLACRIALAQGYRVIGLDVEVNRSYVEETLKVPFFPSTSTSVDLKREGGGVHAALLIAPSIPSMELGVASLRNGGTAVCIGLPPGNLSLGITDFVLKGKRLVGSLVGTRNDAREVLEFCATHEITLPIKTFCPDDLPTCIQNLREGKVTGRQVIRYIADSEKTS